MSDEHEPAQPTQSAEPTEGDPPRTVGADEPPADEQLDGATAEAAPVGASEPEAPTAPSAAEHYHVAPPPPPEPLLSAPATGDVSPATPDPASGAAWRRGITVPLWLLTLLGLIVLVGGAFALGRATADDDTVRGDLAASIRDGSRDDVRPDTPPVPSFGRPLLGVSVRDAADQGGAQLTRVLEGSAADDAGLQVNDVIVAVDGRTITSANDLVNAVGSHQRGDEVEIAYRRGNDRHTVSIELGS